MYKPSGVPALDDAIDTQGTPDRSSIEIDRSGNRWRRTNLVDQILGGAGQFSISALVDQIIKLCGFDIQGWVKDKFVGDFSAVAKSKNAVKSLSDVDHAAATGVADGRMHIGALRCLPGKNHCAITANWAARPDPPRTHQPLTDTTPVAHRHLVCYRAT